MNSIEKIIKLINEKNGIILSKDLTEYNIHRQYLKKAIEMELLQKGDRGYYISPEVFDDEMYKLQSRYNDVIFSHDTALFFHGLIDRDPINYTVTIYEGYNASNIKNTGAKVFFIKKDLMELGLAEGKTVFGRTVRMYDVERTICDVIRNRNQMDVTIVIDAVKNYVKRKDKNIPKLMEYAKILKVDKILRKYLEVLL
jgi:hypothetical protein